MRSPEHSAADLPLGSVLGGRYRLDGMLGRGGMGAVFRATDTTTGEHCAVKVMDSGHDSGWDLTRFKREFRSAARLTHPNCLKVFALDRDGERWFFTMELMTGGCLDRRVQLPPDAVLAVTLQALAALDHIHAKQIIHRDIKPANILLGAAADATNGLPRAKLSDFGIAKVADLEDPQEAGRVVGTLPYMAPEQIIDGQTDPRADLFALGVVIYEMLTGCHPYEVPGSPRARDWVELHRTAQVVPLGEAARSVPDDVAAVIMRLLSKKADERYPTAAMAIDALTATGLGAMIAQALALPPLRRGSYLAPPEFVGREAEMASARQLLTGALTKAEEAPLTLVVEGVAGIGKTRLTNQILRMLPEFGARVYIATCRAEPRPPFDPVAALIRTLSARRAVTTPETQKPTEPAAAALPETGAADASPNRQLSRVDATPTGTGHAASFGDVPTSTGGARAVSTPTSASRESSQPIAGAGSFDEAGQMQWAFFEQITAGLFSVVGEQPLAIVLEDAQWCDAATLQLLGFLMRAAQHRRAQGGSAAVALIITQRPAAEHAALVTFRENMRAQDSAVELELKPLPSEATTRLVASMLMAPVGEEVTRFAERLLQQGAGVPLLISQVLQLLLATGGLKRRGEAWDLQAVETSLAAIPKSIQEAIGDRAARFSAQTQRALGAAAAIGRSFDLETLQHAAQVEALELLDCLDETIRAGFVVEDEDTEATYIFAHDRFRESILTRIPDAERKALHRRVAELIETKHGDDAAFAAGLLHHYEACDNAGKALQYAMVAASHARKTHAYERAAELYAKVRELAQRQQTTLKPSLIERQGDVCLAAGKFDQAAACFRERLPTLPSPTRRGELLRKLAEVEFRRGDNVGARAALERVLRDQGFWVPKTGAHLVNLVRWVFNLALAMFYGLRSRPVTRERLAKSTARRRLVVRVLSRLAEAWFFEDFVIAGVYGAVAANKAQQLGPSPEVIPAAAQMAYGFSTVGLAKMAARYYQRAEEVATTLDEPAEKAHLLTLKAMTYADEGKLAAHVETARVAAVLIDQAGESLRARQALIVHCEGLIEAGRLAGATKVAHRILEMTEHLRDERGLGWAHSLLGQIASCRGDHEAAVQHLRRAVTVVGSVQANVTSRLAAGARLALELALGGETLTALLTSRDDAREYRVRRMRHPRTVCDGAFLVSAALHRQAAGWCPDGVDEDVVRVRRSRAEYAGRHRYTLPLFLAGGAAWDIASGRDVAGGRRGLQHAVEVAREMGLVFAMHDVRAVAAKVLPHDDPERQVHVRELEALVAAARRVES